MISKFSTLLLGLLLSTLCYANNPSPFGLEIGKSTIKDLHRHFHINSVEKYTNFGKIFYIGGLDNIYPTAINEGIKKVGLAFDQHGTLELIEVIFDKSYFDKINHFLAQQYAVVEEKPDHEHDHYTLYTSGVCDIFILSTPQEPTLHVVYATKAAHEKYQHLVPHVRINTTEPRA